MINRCLFALIHEYPFNHPILSRHLPLFHFYWKRIPYLVTSIPFCESEFGIWVNGESDCGSKEDLFLDY
jgi:hypothetical protein